MIDDTEELYDYDVLRRLDEPSMMVVRVSSPVLVLGSAQPSSLVRLDDAPPLRRRRGGGGLVLLQPDDLWVDWWIPSTDPRWRADVRSTSLLAGEWWRDALASYGVTGEIHRGGADNDPVASVACFAGRGPGEVFVEGRKAVGVTQWRVREGAFLSTVLPASPTAHLGQWLRTPVDDLEQVLSHAVVGEWDVDPEDLLEELALRSAPVRRRQLFLIA
ncbi:MAG: hypothetical protein KGR42_08465 [Acidobacteria bacterium]|nr:hypothetical protein [Acidobacteriota bacterium]